MITSLELCLNQTYVQTGTGLSVYVQESTIIAETSFRKGVISSREAVGEST